MSFINCNFLNLSRDETNKEEDEDDEEAEEEEEEEEEQWGQGGEEEGKASEEGVAAKGLVTMKIYAPKSSCKMFNVSMNVLYLQ